MKNKVFTYGLFLIFSINATLYGGWFDDEQKSQELEDIKKKQELFEEKFISFKYLELKPEYLTGKKDFDQEYYEKLDQLENEVLDGKKFKSIVTGNEKI